ANPLDHAQDGQGAGSPRQHCGANLAGARTQTSPAKELQTVTGPEVRRKASGKDRKVSSAAGGNLSRMHKTQETAKESRLNFMYSHLRNRTLGHGSYQIQMMQTEIAFVMEMRKVKKQQKRM